MNIAEQDTRNRASRRIMSLDHNVDICLTFLGGQKSYFNIEINNINAIEHFGVLRTRRLTHDLTMLITTIKKFSIGVLVLENSYSSPSTSWLFDVLFFLVR